MINIIIPVYNAFEELNKCIDSIEQHTDFTSSHVILIDDVSTDYRIRPYLDSLEKDKFTVFYNQSNQGFSANVNKGIESSEDNDVILLNSDTIVTRGWVEKLHECAYSDSSIGIAVPYTNSGTICSIPYYPYGGHAIPANHSIDKFADIIEKHAPDKPPKLSDMVGFCAYIKRDVFNDIGLFDSRAFARGYGEDDDFAFRARLSGYQIVLCANVFIYHSGSVSFGEKSRSELCRNHEKIVKERYPFHYKENQEFVSMNPYWTHQESIRFWSSFDNNKKVIMFVVHRGFERDEADNVGGTQFHVKDLKDALTHEYNIIVFSADIKAINIDAYIGESRFHFKFYCAELVDYIEFNNREIEGIFKMALKAFRVDLVCFHHLKHLSLNLPRIAREMSVPYTVTLHDYYHISPCLRLQTHDGRECIDLENCDGCLSKLSCFSEYTQAPLNLVKKWRESGHKTLEEASAIYSPSQYVKERFLRAFPDLTNISVIPHGHGCNIPTTDSSITECIIEQEQENPATNSVFLTGYAIVDGIPSDELAPYLILDIGGTKVQYEGIVMKRPDIEAEKRSSMYKNSGFRFSVNKAFYSMATVLEIQLRSNTKVFSWAKEKQENRGARHPHSGKKSFNIAILGGIAPEKGSKTVRKMIEKNRADIHWYVIGRCGDEELARMSRKDLTFTGWYQRQEAVPFLKLLDIDIVCLPSTFPETFCYTLSEAYSAGIPVVASNLGALSERIKKDGTGWLVDDFSNPDGFINCINLAMSNPELYSEKKENIRRLQEYTIEKMGDSYSKSYNEIIASAPVAHTQTHDSDKFIIEGISSGSDVLNSQLSDMRRILDDIQNSFTYKVVSKIQSMRIPGKTYIKYCLKAIARRR